MDIQEKTQMYIDFLKGEGYGPTLDKDGDVQFKYEGKSYYIDVNDDDRYFRLVFPAFWSIDSEEELARVLIACDHATNATKVVKVATIGKHKDVSAGAEIFLSEPGDFKAVFQRCLNAIQGAVRYYKEKMAELQA